ncbi:unnamed protein product [Hermetia illucens]|uniref:adenylate cyclase n=2 Tax=Hermetia illucens TaxID=343691 RepID=A0A7R8YVE6_HERIL|nr:unnamed protein product [Hermetia illucens]
MYNYSHMRAIDPNMTTNLTLSDNYLNDKLLEELIFPSFLTNFSVLILISIAIVAQLSHICKILFMFVIATLEFGINLHILGNHFLFEEQHILIGLPTRYNVSSMLFLVTFTLSFLSRYMDKEDRVIFKWRTEVAEQKEKVSDMRRRNEALVYNVLPVHVAEHFMKNKKRSHDDLYSQSYAEVGVLFASMPNFTDFYSEETVNNQGLECLRFLNEVISDYDALLELPQFQDIIKIKTIGSTYMAASGLNPSRQVKPDDPIIIRWAHLALLVEFALELKKALQGINEQSFNHFVLKMGINHGPITAGVIGARKPHYDIWGNTVNVASRMESTGKAGAIQVTEETCQILQTFGYTFEQRGLVSVKGKGQLMTYYLQGKTARPNAPQSPIVLGINTMEPLQEVEEPSESPKILKNSSLTTTATVASSACDSTESQQTSNCINTQSDPLADKCFSNANSVETSEVHLEEKITKSNDPRSPKNNAITADMLALSSTLDQSFEKVEQLTSSSATAAAASRHLNGLNSSDVDLDVDAKTPLLNTNSTNIDCREYNGSEKDSLIEAQ